MAFLLMHEVRGFLRYAASRKEYTISWGLRVGRVKINHEGSRLVIRHI